MDTVGREALATGKGTYKYKDTVDIPTLAMSACGDDSIELNAIINSKIERLEISATKYIFVRKLRNVVKS